MNKKTDLVLGEAQRLYKMGAAIHWLHPRSKRPTENGWTSGPRKPWNYLKETYFPGLNVGVRTGKASLIGKGYLACIDVDIINPEYRDAALSKLKELTGKHQFPEVRSGAGNGSRHLYCLTKEPFKMVTLAKEYHPTDLDEKGKPAKVWEIAVYSEGRQMVLPPSIHPSGATYRWKKVLEKAQSLPLMDFSSIEAEKKTKSNSPSDNETRDYSGKMGDFSFTPQPILVDFLDNISERVRKGIMTGHGVEDRSAFLLPAANALLSAGCSRDEILTVLTERKTFLGECAYEHAKTDNRDRAAYWVWKYTLKRIMDERQAGIDFLINAKVEAMPTLEIDQAFEQAEEFKEASWRQKLVRGGKDGEGAPKATIENVVLILANEIGANIFERDEFAFRDAYGMDTPWGGKKGDAITDDDVAKIRYWLGQNFRFEPGKDIVFDAMTVIACRNGFDPITQWLEALPKWDKKKRLATWLEDHFEAEGDAEYLKQVFTKWIAAHIIRAYEPGAKFDWMPIFEGAQGAGKSSFGRLLVGDKHFLDWLPNLADKDSALALQGMWGVEMSELATLKKTEIEVVKGFITRTVDKVRPPFGRRWIESARRCVFFGTTNRETYLRDDTGNRRFKPIKVGALDFRALERDRDQLFAEAKHMYDNYMVTGGHGLELTGQAKVFEQKIQGDKLVEDDANAMTALIKDFIESESEKDEEEDQFPFHKFQVQQLFSGIGPLHKWRYDARNVQFAGKALKMMGGEKWKSDGRIYWKVTI